MLRAAILLQAVAVLSGPPSARVGQTVTLTLDFTGAQAFGYEWTVQFPAGFTPPIPTAGAAALAAQKQIYCRTAGPALCLAIGDGPTPNQTVIPNGTVAVYSLAVPANQPKGRVSFPLSALLGAGAGNPSPPYDDGVSVTSAPDYVLTVINPDVNGDGVVDVFDYMAAVLQAIGIDPCGAGDVNGDGVCDVFDVQAVSKAIVEGEAGLEIPLRWPAASGNQGIICIVREKRMPGAIGLWWDADLGKLRIAAGAKADAGSRTADYLYISLAQNSGGCLLMDWSANVSSERWGASIESLDLGSYIGKCCPSCPWLAGGLQPCPE